MENFLDYLDDSAYNSCNIIEIELENNKLFSTITEIYKINYYIENCNTFESKSISLKIYPNIYQYKANIKLNTVPYTKIYGYVTDFDNKIANNVEILIFKKLYSPYRNDYIPICSSITDNKGMFQVVIQNHNKASDFKIEIIK